MAIALLLFNSYHFIHIFFLVTHKVDSLRVRLDSYNFFFHKNNKHSHPLQIEAI